MCILYLCFIDEEDNIGDCVDCHVDAQLNRATVADPRPGTQGQTRKVRDETLV